MRLTAAPIPADLMGSPAQIAARTAWGEARNQGSEGMQGVLNTIVNRAAHPSWMGTSVVTVCLAYEQYDCWMTGDSNMRECIAVTEADPQFASALTLAERAVAGTLPDLTRGADSYYAVTIPAPFWVRTAIFTVQIGAQRFYRTIDARRAAGTPLAPAPPIDGPIPIPLS